MATNNQINVPLSGSTGTGNFVGANTPTLITPVLGAATATSVAFSPTTGGIIGTATNDNAGAGFVGEIIESTVLAGSSVAATSTINLDVTSISLTAGDWDVWGNIFLNPNAATTTTFELGWINTVSATQATWPNGGASTTHRVALAAGVNMGFFVGQKRLSLSGTTTVYLSANITFAVNTMGVYGYIGARRVR